MKTKQKQSLGLAGKKKDSKEIEKSAIEQLGGIEAGDLSRFGLIPEFIGRLPVNAMLQELDEDAPQQILTAKKCYYKAISKAI